LILFSTKPAFMSISAEDVPAIFNLTRLDHKAHAKKRGACQPKKWESLSRSYRLYTSLASSQPVEPQ
jgi:hypothetical protein